MARPLPLLLAAGLMMVACATRAPAPLLPIERFVSTIDPGGAGLRSAAILVPGCEGPGAHVAFVAEGIARNGFVVQTLDTPAAFGAGGECAGVPVSAIAEAVARVADEMRRLPNVDRAKLHLIGWAEGGAGIMAALGDPALSRRTGARSAAALYPACERMSAWRIEVPFLLLLADDASACAALAERAPGADRVLAIRYGGTSHRFDVERPPAWRFWQRMPGEFNGAVRDAALQDIRTFFDVPAAP